LHRQKMEKFIFRGLLGDLASPPERKQMLSRLLALTSVKTNGPTIKSIPPETKI